MPDLDDLFEDAVDVVKKRLKKGRKKAKKRQKARKRRETHAAGPGSTASQPAPNVGHRLPTADDSGRDRLPHRARGGGQTTAPLGPLAWAKLRMNGPVARNDRLRAQSAQADAYVDGMKQLQRRARTQANRDRMADLVGRTEHWRQSLRALVTRVDAFKQNEVLQRDLAAVPQAITRLEEELAAAEEPTVTETLSHTLENRRRQWDSLQDLQDTMRHAEVKIENTVSILGTIYSRAHMSQSYGHVADFRRLLRDVEEEALALDDYVTVLGQVKAL